MSVESPSKALRLIGLLGLMGVGFYGWMLYDDFQTTNHKRHAQTQYVKQYQDDVQLYKTMLSIHAEVDAVCLTDGPEVKGLAPTAPGYDYAQQDYTICFEHVFFKPSFQLPFYDEDPRHLFNYTKRVQTFRQELETYRKKYENIEAEQRLLAGRADNAEVEEKFIPFPDDVLELSKLSDIEVYKMMRAMQKRMEASCKQQKEFNPDGDLMPIMNPEEEKIWDENCYKAAVYYHQSLMPYPWWKGLSDLDTNVHYFQARYAAYEARFPDVRD